MRHRGGLKLLLIGPFRSFGLAGVYGFLSAIFIGLSLNLFVSVRVAAATQSDGENAFYISALSFLVSGVALFIVSWELENARTQWISEGTPRGTLMLEPIEERLVRLWGGLCSSLAFTGIGVALVWWQCLPFFSIWGVARCF